MVNVVYKLTLKMCILLTFQIILVLSHLYPLYSPLIYL